MFNIFKKDTYTMEITNYYKDANILDKLNIFDMSIYDDLFSSSVRQKGEEYCLDNKISNIENNNKEYKCIVHGSNDYDVSIIFNNDNNNKIDKMSCTCPYFKEYKRGCKHIYALLYNIKVNVDIELVKQELDRLSKEMKDDLDKAYSYINNNRYSFKENDIKLFNNYYNKMMIYVNSVENNTELDLITILKDLAYKVCEVRETIDDTLSKEDKTIKVSNNSYNNASYNKVDNNVNKKPSLFKSLITTINEVSNNYNNKQNKDKLEEEMKTNELEEYQKELVRNGDYNPWNFEEEDLDEDDYFYDDEE